jgi:hypothetical protein
VRNKSPQKRGARCPMFAGTRRLIGRGWKPLERGGLGGGLCSESGCHATTGPSATPFSSCCDARRSHDEKRVRSPPDRNRAEHLDRHLGLHRSHAVLPGAAALRAGPRERLIPLADRVLRPRSRAGGTEVRPRRLRLRTSRGRVCPRVRARRVSAGVVAPLEQSRYSMSADYTLCCREQNKAARGRGQARRCGGAKRW